MRIYLTLIQIKKFLLKKKKKIKLKIEFKGNHINASGKKFHIFLNQFMHQIRSTIPKFTPRGLWICFVI